VKILQDGKESIAQKNAVFWRMAITRITSQSRFACLAGSLLRKAKRNTVPMPVVRVNVQGARE
jgi:hypothetical protein